MGRETTTHEGREKKREHLQQKRVAGRQLYPREPCWRGGKGKKFVHRYHRGTKITMGKKKKSKSDARFPRITPTQKKRKTDKKIKHVVLVHGQEKESGGLGV